MALDQVCDNQAVLEWSLVDTSREGYEVFVKAHMKKAYYVALGLVGNHEDALELSQDAFARAYQHLDRLQDKSRFYPWFYQILRNLCFSHLRKRRLRQAMSLDAGEEGQTLDVPAEDHFDPEAVASRNENKDRVWKAIGQLDEKHREVIVLRHFQNLSYDEMAKMLFCNKGTVTSRLFHARQKLKAILDREKGGQSS